MEEITKKSGDFDPKQLAPFVAGIQTPGLYADAYSQLEQKPKQLQNQLAELSAEADAVHDQIEALSKQLDRRDQGYVTAEWAGYKVEHFPDDLLRGRKVQLLSTGFAAQGLGGLFGMPRLRSCGTALLTGIAINQTYNDSVKLIGSDTVLSASKNLLSVGADMGMATGGIMFLGKFGKPRLGPAVLMSSALLRYAASALPDRVTKINTFPAAGLLEF